MDQLAAFDPVTVEDLTLPNRVVMAPMTRSRAYGPGQSPTSLMAEYYAQRASAGLIISEGTQPSVVGQGYPSTPGLHSDEQTAAWREVTDAVHAAGGRIFAQLLHTGRIGHPLLIDGRRPVAPSAVRPKVSVFTPQGLKDCITPQAMTGEAIEQTLNDFVVAARNAVAAGFDGIEVHGANGYLVHQFLDPTTNLRTDGWGGSVERRIRFAAELIRRIADAIGPSRTAMRVSPGNPYNDMSESDPHATYLALAETLRTLGLAYLHVVETGDRDLTRKLRAEFGGVFILNAHTAPRPTGPEELALVEDGTTDLLSFGALFLANPDLPRRLATGGPFNTPARERFYGGDERGYTDYPALPDQPLDGSGVSG
ncbi:alkene reductase [Actinoallomurus sp. CA-142502]|uniref:alkene reductase n=1 Tax=Actinoallomurus sp. CA-142502 TaxID=3239885 RepID=UPI003D92A5A8